MLRPAGDVPAANPDDPLIQRHAPGHAVEQGGLARSVDPNDHHKGPRIDREAHALERPLLARRSREEGVAEPDQLEGRPVHAATGGRGEGRKARPSARGRTSAKSTNTAVTSLSAFASRPARSAAATRRRKTTVPTRTPVIWRAGPLRPTRASPTMRQASPTTTIPRPICTFANPWYCANSAPERAIRPLAITRPSVTMNPTSTPSARAI